MKILCEISGIDEEMKSQVGSAVFLVTLEIPPNLCVDVGGSQRKP